VVLRIISGTARGTHLQSPNDKSVRPTPDRVREAIFSILYSQIGPLTGFKVLDLFSGTGAMALEALSRGATKAWLVDPGEEAGRIIPANIKNCHFGERAVFVRQGASAALKRLTGDAPFELICMDPPYGRDLIPPVLSAIDELSLLAEQGLVVAESGLKDPVPDKVGGLTCLEHRRYGSTIIHLFAATETKGTRP
jgi:16S rRNA (guanine966-N2)-methyltransferase